jgi:hypothetical protein
MGGPRGEAVEAGEKARQAEAGATVIQPEEEKTAPTEPGLAARIEATDRALKDDPRFEPDDGDDPPEGTIEVSFGARWIPGSRRPKGTEE